MTSEARRGRSEREKTSRRRSRSLSPLTQKKKKSIDAHRLIFSQSPRGPAPPRLHPAARPPSRRGRVGRAPPPVSRRGAESQRRGERLHGGGRRRLWPRRRRRCRCSGDSLRRRRGCWPGVPRARLRRGGLRGPLADIQVRLRWVLSTAKKGKDREIDNRHRIDRLMPSRFFSPFLQPHPFFSRLTRLRPF